jgi:hypothetical protein
MPNSRGLVWWSSGTLDDHGDHHHVNEYVGLHFVSVENTKHIDKHFKELTSLQGDGDLVNE